MKRTTLLAAPIAALAAVAISSPVYASTTPRPVRITHLTFSEDPAVVGDTVTVFAAGRIRTRHPLDVTVLLGTEGVTGPGQTATCILAGRTWAPTDAGCVFDRVRRGQTWRVKVTGTVDPDHPEYIAAGITATTKRGAAAFYCQDPVAGHEATWLGEKHYTCR